MNSIVCLISLNYSLGLDYYGFPSLCASLSGMQGHSLCRTSPCVAECLAYLSPVNAGSITSVTVTTEMP